MQDNFSSFLFPEWENEISTAILENRSLCIALLSIEGSLIFANPQMLTLFSGELKDSFINPTFEKIISLSSNDSLVYDGFLTLGDYSSVNTSIMTHIYRKNNKLLIIGGVDVEQLVTQNHNLHQMNHDINNLQRDLIKEKHNLESTLKKLDKANNELKELVATRDKLFSIIAHDLKSPFNGLLGLTELLSENAKIFPPEKLSSFAKEVNTSSKQAYKLLENLLEWSRSQTGKLKPNRERIKPSEVISEVKHSCKNSAYAKNIALHSKLEFDEIIHADREMLKTILRNLTTNALKFTSPGGRVTLKTTSNKDQIIFTVSDTGFGIEPQYIDGIFGVDCKLSRKGTANESGTGLGLILCKEFVEKHSGQIWAESTPGKGSDFFFSLPLQT